MFDPQFSASEEAIIKMCNLELIDTNEVHLEPHLQELSFTLHTMLQQEGKRKATQRTLFYMPHAGKRLYSNLLWANWGENLSNLIILGNSFANYNTRQLSTKDKEKSPYVLKVS